MSKRTNAFKNSHLDKDDNGKTGNTNNNSNQQQEQGNGRKVFNPKRNYPAEILKSDGVPMDSKFGKNDDQFWIANNALVEDAAKVSMFTVNGYPLQQNYFEPGFNNPDTPLENVNYQIIKSAVNTPGIMNFHVMMTPGDLSDAQSPYNKGLNMVFQFMQRLTGRVPSYDPNNLGLYFLAHDSAFVWWCVLTRVYGTMSNWAYENDYTPRALVRSMGFDFDDLKRNKANLLASINQYAFQLAAYPLPSIWKFVTRHQRLFEAIYTDSDSEINGKAQFYVFQPDYLWQYVEGIEAEPLSSLTSLPLPRATASTAANPLVPLFTYEDIVETSDQILNSLSNSSTLRDIKSDILNSFGDDLVTLSPIDVDYKVTPIYEKGMLEQIENAYIYGIDDNYTMRLIQNPNLHGGGGLQSEYEMYLADARNVSGGSATPNMGQDILQNLQATEAIINFHSPGPQTAETIMHPTRFSGLGLKDGRNSVTGKWNLATTAYAGFWGNVFDVISYATVTYWDCVWQQDDLNTGKGSFRTPILFCQQFSSVWLVDHASTSMNTYDNIDNVRAAVSKFDWHPAYKIVHSRLYGGSGSAPSTRQFFVGDANIDYDNWGLIARQQLELMNKAAQLSLFTPVGLGGFSPNQGSSK